MNAGAESNSHDVVVNGEEQFSIWPTDREPPSGWRRIGLQGTERYCLDYIQKTWTDMRPLSTRELLRRLRDNRFD